MQKKTTAAFDDKHTGSYKYANIEDFQGIITDENLTETEEKELLKYAKEREAESCQ